jgi:hypothetical protein
MDQYWNRGLWRVDRPKLEEYIERVNEEQQWVRTHPLTRKERDEVEERWGEELSS